MIRNVLFLLAILLVQSSCTDLKSSNQKDSEQDFPMIMEIKELDLNHYVKNPDETDTLCISEAERAKKALQNDQLSYVNIIPSPKRYLKELKYLCKKYGIKYETEFADCIVYSGQIQGCYRAFMDNALIEKYGSEFKENLDKQADSLYLINVIQGNLAVHSWYCDVKPKPVLDRSTYLKTTLEVENIDLKRTELRQTWPSLDLILTIESDGTISNFENFDYMPELKHNEKFEQKLYMIAVEHIQTNYPDWNAGLIKDTPVRSFHDLRFTFISK